MMPPAADVFWLSLDRPTDRWWPLLDAAEQRRARSLPTTLLCRRFVVRRGLVKQALASFMDTPVREVTIGADGHGRPHMHARPGIRFSVAHRGPVAALAVTADGSSVGVDIECVTERMLAYALTSRERAEIATLAPRERPLAFHAMWTAKEAVAKATGRGMARCSIGVDVALAAPAGGPCLAYDLLTPPAAWPIARPAAPRPGYATALVTGASA